MSSKTEQNIRKMKQETVLRQDTRGKNWKKHQQKGPCGQGVLVKNFLSGKGGAVKKGKDKCEPAGV